MGFLDKLFDPGRDDREEAARLAKGGIIKGGTVSGDGGIGAGFDFSNGKTDVNTSLGSFGPLLEALQSVGAEGLSQAGGDLPQSLKDLAAGTIGELGTTDQLSGASDFAGLGEVFGNALGTASSDPFALGAGVSEKLRALSERRNQRLVSKTFDRLKSSGKLGTTGGAGIAGELDANLFDEGLKFDLAGLDAGRSLQGDAFQRLLDSSGAREGIAERTFAESQGINQNALQQFAVGDSTFGRFLQNQQQGANIGLAATGAAGNLSQLPLPFIEALLAAGGQASNSQFAASGISQNNAGLATSPFLEALKAIGQFVPGATPAANPATTPVTTSSGQPFIPDNVRNPGG